MKISLIISYYKNLGALELIFHALRMQLHTNFEVIIAEDDNGVDSSQFVSEAIRKMPFSIKHVHQEEDKGFRKTIILNKAIEEADGEFLVFLDGDCIPHKKFLSSYVHSACENTALFGRRVMLSEKITKELYKEKNLRYLSLLYIWKSESVDQKYSLYLPFFKKQYKLGIFGCNWGIFKNKIIEVNGFDEDYVSVGVGEDNDIEWRLIGNGMKTRSIRYSAIVYHLYHRSQYTDQDLCASYCLLKEKQASNQIFCKNGLVKV